MSCAVIAPTSSRPGWPPWLGPIVAGAAHHPEAAVVGVQELHGAIEALERNPNEHLLLQALFLRLPGL